MIGALAAPHGHDRSEIKIPTGHGSLARAYQFFDAGVYGDGRHSRRCAESFLRTTEADINFFAVNVQRHSGESRNGVHNEQSAELVSHFAEVGDALDYAAGRFAMRETDEFDVFPSAGAADIFRVHGAAVERLDANHFHLRAAFGDHGHAFGKPTVAADDALVAFFQGIQYGCFDSAGTGGRNREGDAILRLENAPQ